jgi:hypothetical protein
VSELCHPPEYGATKLTGAGDGALLNVPVAVNCTWPMGELSPLAVCGVTVTNCSTRLEFELDPHPMVWRTNIPTKKIVIKFLRSGMETSLKFSGYKPYTARWDYTASANPAAGEKLFLFLHPTARSTSAWSRDSGHRYFGSESRW